MAFTPLNSTHPIVVFTFSGAATLNLGVDVLGLADPNTSGQGRGLVGQCAWFGVQNQTGADLLLTQSASATKGMLILDGQNYRPEPDTDGNGYDMFEYWLVSAAAGDVCIERKIK